MKRDFIGSSDISVLLRVNPNKTILELWAEKIGAVKPDDLSDNEAVEWGTRLEKIVAKKFAEKHKVKLIAYKKRFVHPKYSYLTCELDNIISGTDELCEIKTTSLWNYKEWASSENVPSLYQAQVMWQLGISGRKIGWIAVLVGGQRYLEKRIEFDKKVFDEMVKKAVDFWTKYVIPKSMPEQITADDSDILYKIYPEVTIGEDIALTDKANVFIEQIQSAIQDKIAAEQIIDRNKNELKALLKENECGHTNLWRINWKEVLRKSYTVPESKSRQLRYFKITKEG